MSASPVDLAREAEVARAEFLQAVAGLAPAQREASRLVGEWGLREVVAHLGYWAGNTAQALHEAAQGRAEEVPGLPDVDERNAVVARVARETDIATVSKREEAAFNALLDRLRRADPDWLGLRIANGRTIGHLVQEDGIDHYRDHAADLRNAAGGKGMNADRRDTLVSELVAARDAFVGAVADVDPDLFTAPGLVGDWSARDLVAHVAFWSDHGADALELAAADKGRDFDYDSSQTDAINEEVFAGASTLTPMEAYEREQVAFERFRDILSELDPLLLDETLGNGDTVEAVVRYDGPDHYAEHTEHIRAWFTGHRESDDDEAS